MKNKIFDFGGGAGIGSYVIVLKYGELFNVCAREVRTAFNNGESLFLSIIDDSTEETLLPLTGYVNNEDQLIVIGRDFDDNQTYNLTIEEGKDPVMEVSEGVSIGEGVIPTSGGGVSQMMIEITMQALYELKQSSLLIPGMWYRITDYAPTYSGGNYTMAGHQFDIVVFATGIDSIAAQCLFARHAGDSYFANSDLSKWKGEFVLEKLESAFTISGTHNHYGNDWPISGCIYDASGNITVDGVYYYCITDWSFSGPGISIGTRYVTAGVNKVFEYLNGEMVEDANFNITGILLPGILSYGYIDKLIDEFDNECPYDFKNVKYTSISYLEYTYTNAYTFSQYATDVYDVTVDASLNSQSKNVYGNKIIWKSSILNLPQNVWLRPNTCSNNTFGDNCSNNTFGDLSTGNNFDSNCFNNTFGDSCQYNTFGDSCQYNTFGINCSGNSFGDGSSSNTFGDSCSNTTFSYSCSSNTFGDSCSYNTFGDNCSNNTFGNSCANIHFASACQYNSFGNGCYYNTFVNGCSNNNFSPSCQNNSFGYGCYHNTFGNGCSHNTFGNSCAFSTLGNGCQYNTFGTDCSNTFGDSCSYNTFGNLSTGNTFGTDCSNNIFGDGCSFNFFGDGCAYNNFGQDCQYNTFGNNGNNNVLSDHCSNNYFGDGTTPINFVKNITLDSNCSYIHILSDDTSEADYSYLQNIHIQSGISGTEAQPLSISIPDRNLSYMTDVLKGSDDNVYFAVFNGTGYTYTPIV